MKILLVRLRLIGDVIFTTPAVRALKRRLPDAHLTYLTEPAAAPVLDGNPHLDDIITLPRARGVRRLGDDVVWARRLRKRRFDLAIDFHGGPRSRWLTWASAAPMRIGYAVPGSRPAYTHRVVRPADLAPRHAVRNQWDLLGPLGGAFTEPPSPKHDAVEMPENSAATRRVVSRLSAAGVSAGEPLIVLHTSAGNRFRRWPIDAFADTVAQLARRDGARSFVVTAGPSEPGAVARLRVAVATRLGGGGPAIIDGDQFGLAELRSLIDRAAVFIGGDSGPLHVAATTRTPIVGIYGPTLEARSAPWRDPACVTEAVHGGPLPCRPCAQRQCEPGDFRCLTQVTAAMVTAAVERAMVRATDTA